MDFRVQGSGFRVQSSGFRVQGSGLRVQGSGVGTGRKTVNWKEARGGISRRRVSFAARHMPSRHSATPAFCPGVGDVTHF